MFPKKEDIDQAIAGRNFDFPKGRYDPRLDRSEPIDPENTPEPFETDEINPNSVQGRLLVLGKQADEVMGLVIGLEDRLSCCLGSLKESDPKNPNVKTDYIGTLSNLEKTIEGVGLRLTEAANRLREVTGAIRL